MCLAGIAGKEESADTLEQYPVNADVECRFIRQEAFPAVTRFKRIELTSMTDPSRLVTNMDWKYLETIDCCE